jgi:hypothetical protein
MRRREEVNQSAIELFAKEFTRFLNRVENQSSDVLGSFLIESEWERYLDDARSIVQSFETAGYVLAPVEPTEPMVQKADPDVAAGKTLLNARGLRGYLATIYRAMIHSWTQSRDTQLILDIISMALARASDPAAKRNPASFVDSSFRRYAKNSMDILNDVEKAGFILLPDEPTPHMLSSAVRMTADNRENAKAIGADPKYIKTIYENMIKYRPDYCRPQK